MKNLLVEEWVQIPDNGMSFRIDNSNLVTLTVKTRTIKVKGPRGEITKNFRHMPVELTV